jgi:hypothetical protein
MLHHKVRIVATEAVGHQENRTDVRARVAPSPERDRQSTLSLAPACQ